MASFINLGPSRSQLLGEQLGQGLNQGISGALSQHFQQKQNQKSLSGLAPLFEQLGVAPDGIGQLVESGLSPQEAIATAGILQKQQAAQQKARGKTTLTPEKQEGLKSVYSRMQELLNQGRLGISKSPIHLKANPYLNPQSVEDRAEFDTLNANFEAILKDMVNTGVLSKPRFEYLLSILPKSSDRDRKIKGKLKALAQIPELQFLSGSSESRESSSKERPPLSSFEMQ